MKRTILTSIIGLAAATDVMSAQAQGNLLLNNYSNTGAQVLYGPGSGGPVGTGLLNGIGAATWTIGIYGAIGNVTVAAGAMGTADPSTLGPVTLLQGTAGDTTTINNSYVGGGYYASTADAVLPGYSSGTATFVLVAYNSSTYDASTIRAHSVAFNLTPATGAAAPPDVSETTSVPIGLQTTFEVLPVLPEPSVFALSSIGAAALMLIRRRK